MTQSRVLSENNAYCENKVWMQLIIIYNHHLSLGTADMKSAISDTKVLSKPLKISPFHKETIGMLIA